MKQFILNAEPGKNGQVRLAGGDYHYLVKVRRLAPGEFFPALLPNGAEVSVRVLSVDNKILAGEVSPYALSPPSGVPKIPPVILFQALPKGEKMDTMVRQAAECGVAEIAPFASEFSMVKIGQPCQKFSRWERIIKEARQQSGSATATGIRQPASIDGLFEYWEQVKLQYSGVLGLLFHHLPLAGAGCGLANISLHRYLYNRPEMVALAIGPEGGFSPAEADRFVAAGFKPFNIEGAVLRTETAALYALAAVQIILLEKDSWEVK